MSCAVKEADLRKSEVMCDQDRVMSEGESSPEVRVFMTEKEALWHEFEHGFSQQGSSSEGNPFADIPSARALSHSGVGPSGRMIEEVDSEDEDAEVDSEETEVLATTTATDAESDMESHPGEGITTRK